MYSFGKEVSNPCWPHEVESLKRFPLLDKLWKPQSLVVLREAVVCMGFGKILLGAVCVCEQRRVWEFLEE